MTYRLVKEQEHEKILELCTYAFNLKENKLFQSRGLENWTYTENWGKFRKDKLSSQIVLFPFAVNLYGKKIKMAGVGNVATYPEWRGQGDIRQLFVKAMESQYNQGTVLSYLAPFNRTFYYKFGYANVFIKNKVEIKTKDINQLIIEKTEDLFRAGSLTNDQKNTIKYVYNRYTKNIPGSLNREDWWWDHYFHYAKNSYFVTRNNDLGECLGYLRYEIENEQLIVQEMCYFETLTLRKFLSFVASHSDSFEKFVFETGQTKLIKEYLLETNDVIETIQDGMMVKIVSLEKFINMYPFKRNCNLECTIFVNDSFSEWNHGMWKLEVVTGNGRLTKLYESSDIQADFEGEIQTWTQILFNRISIKEALFLKKIVAKETEKIDNFADILLTDTVHLYDSF